MFNHYRVTIYTVFFILLTAPTIASAIPVTYQFDALDWYNPDQTFTGTISFESSTTGVQTSPGSGPGFPGSFYYENAILNITLDYGGTIITQYGGSIHNDCTYDPSFSISAGSFSIELAQPSCLPGADQTTLSSLDLTVLNDIISYPYPALYHPGAYIDANNSYSSFAHPFNFSRVPNFVSEPTSLLLFALGVITLGLTRRRHDVIKFMNS